MVSTKVLTSKSILNLLFDHKKLQGRAQYGSRKKIIDEDQYWSSTCTVELVGKNAEIPVRIVGSGTDTKKGVAITLAADSAVAQLKTCSAALEDEFICKTLKVPFGDNAGGITGAEKTIATPAEVGKEKILGGNMNGENAIACTDGLVEEKEKIGGPGANGEKTTTVTDGAYEGNEKKIVGEDANGEKTTTAVPDSNEVIGENVGGASK